MQVNKTKFRDNISLEYYHMTYTLGKQKIQALELSLSNEQKNCELHPNGTIKMPISIELISGGSD